MLLLCVSVDEYTSLVEEVRRGKKEREREEERERKREKRRETQRNSKNNQ